MMEDQEKVFIQLLQAHPSSVPGAKLFLDRGCFIPFAHFTHSSLFPPHNSSWVITNLNGSLAFQELLISARCAPHAVDKKTCILYQVHQPGSHKTDFKISQKILKVR